MHIRPLRPSSAPYYLVVFGAPNESAGVAAVDALDGTVRSWAALPRKQGHVVITADKAVARSGLGKGARAEAVWEPSALSRSQLYPFWAVSAGSRTFYVDWQGQVWQSVERGGPGGSTPT
jgi:hypothetical protein